MYGRRDLAVSGYGAPDSYPAAERTGIEAADLLRILIQRYRILLGVAVLVLGGTIAALAIVTPRYEAKAVMLVDTDAADSSSATGTPAQTREVQQWRDYQMQTQIQFLNSRPLVRRVAEELGLAYDPEFNSAISSKPASAKAGAPAAVQPRRVPITPQVIEAVTDQLASALKVEQDAQSSFINVRVRSTDAVKAARIANQIVNSDVEMQIEEKRAVNKGSIMALNRQVKMLRDQLLSTEESIANYRYNHQIDPSAADASRAAQTAQIAAELSAARASSAEADARSAQAGPRSGEMSPLLGTLRQQETELTRRLAELSTLYGPGYSDVQKASAELARVKDSIAAENRRINEQLASESSAKHAREAQLLTDLGSVQAESLNQGLKQAPLLTLERNAEALRTMYVGLLGTQGQMIRENDSIKPTASIAFKALVPIVPSYPNSARAIGVAAVVALVFGVILVMIVEALDTKVRTAAQVYSLTGTPLIGMVPSMAKRDRKHPTHVAVIDQPYSSFAEAMRSIQGRLARQFSRASGNVILVTSPLPQDGKTTISIGLAAAAIATQRSAVLVDLDLRRPELVKILGFEQGEVDLFDYLSGEASLDDILTSANGPGLSAISVRSPARDPGAVLASPRLATLFDELRERFDTIIVNSPPVLAVSDAQEISRYADAVLLVLNWRKTSRDVLRATMEQFDGVFTAAAFNHVDRSSKHARMAYGEAANYNQKSRRRTSGGVRGLVNLSSRS